MSKNMDEYASIRSEIISMEEQQRNVWIHMYVLFITIFVLGLELSYHLFLVTYIVLIPFQIVINRYCWSIAKMSAFIRLFYEQDDTNLNWESMHTYIEYKYYYKGLNSSLTGKIRYTGVAQLGFLATVFYIGYSVCNVSNRSQIMLNSLDLILIIISVCLFFLTVMLNKEYRKNYVEDLENVIQKYKDNLKDKKKK